MRPQHGNSGNVQECIVRIRSHAMSGLTFVPRPFARMQAGSFGQFAIWLKRKLR
jgi:hypothetical protein